jgi:hypothetical protein
MRDDCFSRMSLEREILKQREFLEGSFWKGNSFSINKGVTQTACQQFPADCISSPLGKKLQGARGKHVRAGWAGHAQEAAS